ncbi:MAG TPA: cytochrome c-type biogenesis CcmF C-terminal domain-containing protein [Solirubrobacteraceae bacterium]|jgi:cytochrome c-type biogenesis protein CcmF
MASLGSGALIFALVVCAYGIGASVYGVRNDEDRWIESGRRAVYGLALVLLVAFIVIEVAFLKNDYGFNTVADTSSATTPLFYRAAAVWSSQEGSLLVWALLSSLWSSLALFLVKGKMREVAAYAAAILLAFDGFFIALAIFYANPFNTTSPKPLEGAGLDPLLRFPAMIIHPPMIYSGYTLCIVPFAFGMGALIARRVDTEWITATRRFALAAWLFLGVGIVLGALWSYSELGWGGYWEWDPVENAALMPWLMMTAFLHSAMIQEKRGMLKVWNSSLVLAAGTLAITGTFLVRSGVLSSIHAFGGATLGVPFVILIGLMIACSIYLVVSRREQLSSSHRLDSLFSRESVFLLNNIVLVGLCFVIFWGTFFPLISEMATGQAASVGAPWFDRYTVPLALILVLLSGIGPVIAWRKASVANVKRNFATPVLAALATLIVLLALGVTSKLFALVMFCLAAFTIGSVTQELWRGTRVRSNATGQVPPRALLGLVGRNRRRYGGYMTHVGIAMLFVGVAGSSSFMHAAEPRLSVGKSIDIGGYRMKYIRPTASVTAKNDAAETGATLDLGAVLRVSKKGRYVTTLRPSEGYYDSDEAGVPPESVGHLIAGTPVSHVTLSSNPLRNVWAAIEPDLQAPKLQRIIAAGNKTIPIDKPEDGMIALAVLAREYLAHPQAAKFNLRVQPLLMWIWIGAIIVAAGGLIALSPTPRTVVRRVSVRAARRRAESGLARA